MQASRRWRDWVPKAERGPSEVADRTDNTDGASLAGQGALKIVSYVSASVRPDLENSTLVIQDPGCWEDDFGRWALKSCLFRDRCSWSVEALHDHFCYWSSARSEVPCNIFTFAALLESEGFAVVARMVYGLVLREEYRGLSERDRKGIEPVRSEL